MPVPGTLFDVSKSSSVLPEVENETIGKLQPLYHVILLNDEDHTYDYVVEMLQKIFGMSEATAFSHAVEVDTKGTTILLTCELEKAELKRDQVHAYGPDWRLPRSLGSMAAIVEPATG
jgi:ATP-dependent Clp protease adaptor protein ClpS